MPPTPSPASLSTRPKSSAGDVVRFGVAFTPAQLFGRVLSDAGDGVGGISFALTRGASHLEAQSDSGGAFAMSGAPGEWMLTLDAASLPPGYSPAGPGEHGMRLERGVPRTFATVLRANRSVSGRAPAGAREIVVEPLGIRVPVGDDGRFSVRSLPAGELTLRAGTAVYCLTMPAAPTSINDVVMQPAAEMSGIRTPVAFTNWALSRQ